MILEQLMEKLNSGGCIYLYTLDQNCLYGGSIEDCPKRYLSCGIDFIEIGKWCLFITLQIKDGHF